MPLIVWMTPVGIGKIEADPQARLAHAGNPRFEQVALDPAIVNQVDSAGGLGVPQRHAIEAPALQPAIFTPLEAG